MSSGDVIALRKNGIRLPMNFKRKHPRSNTLNKYSVCGIHRRFPGCDNQPNPNYNETHKIMSDDQGGEQRRTLVSAVT
jgi:hypothetical protein